MIQVSEDLNIHTVAKINTSRFSVVVPNEVRYIMTKKMKYRKLKNTGYVLRLRSESQILTNIGLIVAHINIFRSVNVYVQHYMLIEHIIL